MASFQRFVDSQMSPYEAFAQLSLASRLKAALGMLLVSGAGIALVYLVYRPYLYTSGPAGQRVLWAFAVLYASFALLCTLPMLLPSVTARGKTVTVVSALLGAGIGVLGAMAASGESVPLFGVLFENEPATVVDGIFFLVLASFSAGSMLVGARLSEVQEERSRMKTELQLAQEIQERLLPVVDERTEAFAAFGTARLASEVGGDFFDLVTPDAPGAPLVVAVGDVSGHNAAAGLMAAMTKGTLRGALAPSARPVAATHGPGGEAFEASPEGGEIPALADRARNVLETMNRTVYAHAGRQHFVSGQIGLFDFAAEHLVLGNAGHVPLLCRRADGSVETFAPKSAALGLLPAGAAGIQRVPFGTDDTFLFYTDGLLEARSPGGEEFGLERLRTVLAEATASSSPQALCKQIFATLGAHMDGMPPSDDVTLLAVRVDR